MPSHQYSFELISHQVENKSIQQRAVDGYINASQLCKVAGRRWHQYQMEGGESTGKFLRALGTSLGLTREELIQQLDGDTWVHPQVAVDLGSWLSVDFKVMVTSWVHKWMSGQVAARPAVLPYHLQRHMANFGKVPMTHFSILQQMTTSLIAPLEAYGYTLPEEMLPDISQGQMFCRFAREKLGLDTDSFPNYEHEFPDGRKVPAKLYPIEYLGQFCTYINEVWMPQRSADYFKKRDPQALPYLDKVLRISYQPPRLVGFKKKKKA